MASLVRREFIGGLAAAIAAGAVALNPRPADAEPPPEKTKLRIAKVPAICLAPIYLAEDLLRAEGFTEIEYVEMDLPQMTRSVANGSIDISAETAPELVMELDAGGDIVVIGGLHVGCYELVGGTRIRRIPEGAKDVVGSRSMTCLSPRASLDGWRRDPAARARVRTAGTGRYRSSRRGTRTSLGPSPRLPP